MGQAKRRGTFEQRKAAAIERDASEPRSPCAQHQVGQRASRAERVRAAQAQVETLSAVAALALAPSLARFRGAGEKRVASPPDNPGGARSAKPPTTRKPQFNPRKGA